MALTDHFLDEVDVMEGDKLVETLFSFVISFAFVLGEAFEKLAAVSPLAAILWVSHSFECTYEG